MDGHREYGINVKSSTGYWDAPDAFETVGADEAESLWDWFAQSFWDDADRLAREHGYTGVHQEGRSGGWLVPHLGGRAVCARERFAVVIGRLLENAEGAYLEAIRERAAELERIEHTNQLATKAWRE